jgi:hypothetical protein
MQLRICGQVESTSHFLISCKKYTDLRNELMYTINYLVTIDVKLLLKGSDTVSVHAQLGVISLKVCFDNVREGIGVTYLFKICSNSISVRSFRCAQH